MARLTRHKVHVPTVLDAAGNTTAQINLEELLEEMDRRFRARRAELLAASLAEPPETT